jgi:hypothetical protein
MPEPHKVMAALFRSNLRVAVGGSLLGAAITLAVPSYYPLLQPDSASYISFDRSRTAFYPLFLRALASAGLDWVQITYVQFLVFQIALVFLLLAMLRAGCRPLMVFIFVVVLAANAGFSSVHWSILTESISFSLTAITIALLLDYLRTGRAGFIVGACLCVGLLYGIRPAAITLIPMLVVAVSLKWSRRDWPSWALLAGLVLALAVGPVLENVAFRLEHARNRATIVPNMLMGKAAMLIRGNTVYSGPHADILNQLGTELYSAYAPVHKFLTGLPSLVAWPVISSTYEEVAQFSILNEALEKASTKTGLSQDLLRDDLGVQAIENNIGGYLRLSLLNYFGQWSVTALTFPPAARAFNGYVDSYPTVPLRNNIAPVTLHPPASNKSYLIYPAFLFSGLVSFVLSIGLLAFIWRPRLAEKPRLNSIMIAGFFGAMCQIHTIVISFINVPIPRYLMAIYPQLILMFMFLIVAAFPNLGVPARPVATAEVRRPDVSSRAEDRVFEKTGIAG